MCVPLYMKCFLKLVGNFNEVCFHQKKRVKTLGTKGSVLMNFPLQEKRKISEEISLALLNAPILAKKFLFRFKAICYF